MTWPTDWFGFENRQTISLCILNDDHPESCKKATWTMVSKNAGACLTILIYQSARVPSEPPSGGILHEESVAQSATRIDWHGIPERK